MPLQSLPKWHVVSDMNGGQSEVCSHCAPQSFEQPLQLPDEQANGLHAAWLIHTLNEHWPAWHVYCLWALLQPSLHVNGSVWQTWPSLMFWHICLVLVTE